MFYLTTLSKHFNLTTQLIHFFRRKEGNFVFNDALNTFYLWLLWCRTTQIVRGNPLPPHGLLFPISSKGSFICTSHGGELAGTRNNLFRDYIITASSFVTGNMMGYQRSN